MFHCVKSERQYVTMRNNKKIWDVLSGIEYQYVKHQDYVLLL